ncbi:MAG: glycerol-3-phosphate acyltransferase, partial [Pseudomonadales bacterium]
MSVAIPLAVVAYLIGGVPTAYLLGRRLRGVDIRALGSRNVGAVNAFKQLGWKIGLLVLAIDVGKGAGLTMLATAAGIGAWGVSAVVVAATVGNNWSPYLRLSGGKGVAVVFGISLVMVPLLSIAALPFTVIGFVITRGLIWSFVTGAI